MGVWIDVPGRSEKVVYYYMMAGKNFKEVYELSDLILKEAPQSLLNHAETCQRSWVNQTTVDLSGLDPDIALFKRSLLIIKTQTDIVGAIVAAND